LSGNSSRSLVEKASEGEEVVLAGSFTVPPDFGAPLPSEVLAEFEGEDRAPAVDTHVPGKAETLSDAVKRLTGSAPQALEAFLEAHQLVLARAAV
jgi:hypothetical protein